MSKKAIALIAVLILVGIGFAAGFGLTLTPFASSMPTGVYYRTVFDTVPDVADSLGANPNMLLYFPPNCIGAMIWHEDAGNDSIQFSIPALYGYTDGLTYTAVPFKQQAINDTLKLYGAPLDIKGLDVYWSNYGDTLQLFCMYYIYDAKATQMFNP